MQAILPPPNSSVITEDQLRNAAIQATRIEEVSYKGAGSKVKYESQFAKMVKITIGHWYFLYIFHLGMCIIMLFLQSHYYDLMAEKIYELLKNINI